MRQMDKMGKKNKKDLIGELRAGNREISEILESLESREKQFRSVVETAREAIISVNSDDEIIFWNQGAETIFGYSSDEMLGKSVTAVMPEQYRALHKKGLKRVVKTGKSKVIGQTVELLGLRKDGSEFPVELSLAKWAVGGETFFTAIIRDVTERKRAEEAVSEKRKLNALLLNSLPYPTMIIRKDRTVLASNKAAEDIGVYPGCICWRDFGKSASIPEKDKRYIEEKGSLPDHPVRCTFCLADEALKKQTPMNTDVEAGGKVWDTYWIPLTKDTYLHYAIDVTERKDYESELKENKDWLNKAQQIAHMGSWGQDPETDRLWWSDETYRIFGLSPQQFEMTFDEFMKFVLPEDRKMIIEKTTMALKSDKHPYRAEYRLTRPDGSVRRVYEEAEIVRNDLSGKPVRIMGIIQDITEKKLNELELETHRIHLEELVAERTKELQESEERYKKLLDSVTDYIYSVSVKDGKPVSSSHGPGCAAVTGYSPEDYQANPDLWFKMVYPEDQPMVHENISMLLSGKEVPAFEHRIIARDCSLRWIRNTPVLRYDEKGEFIAYDGLVRDVTARKNAEIDLLKSNKLLDTISRAQHQFITDVKGQALFDNLLEDILSITRSEYGFIGELFHDPDGNPYLNTHAITNIAWNKATREFYEQHKDSGFEFRNLKTLFGAVLTSGKPLISNGPATDPRRGGLPEGHPPLNSFMGLPLYRGKRMIGMVGIANRLDGYDESLFKYLSPLLGTCASIIEAFRGNMKRLEAEDAIKNYAEKLEESNRFKDLFTDIMRHDLLNPINLVINFAELLLGEESDPRMREMAEEIVLNASSLASLIKSASKYSQLENMEKVDFQNLDIHKMLKEAIHTLAPKITKKKIKVECTRKKKCLVPVNAMLSDVFYNLLSNAVKYSPAGSSVEIGIKNEKEAWVISFRDSGSGVADADKERIFERFERAAGPGRRTGTGLGLAIAKRIVDLHGGRIWVEDNRDGGSLFCVSLLKERPPGK